MASVLSNTFEKLLFRPATVITVDRIAQSFQLVTLEGEGLRGVTVIPGQTIQFLVGSMTKRAYTPIDHDPQAGLARFLFYLHGAGPGSAWATTLTAGDVCKVMRPKNSIDFTKAEGSPLFFGDETSFAAAQVLQRCRQGKTPAQFVFEVASPADARILTAELGLEEATLITKNTDGTHIEAVVKKLIEDAVMLGLTQWYFTGNARSIQSIRKALKSADIPLQKSVVKAYWSPGRTGMD